MTPLALMARETASTSALSVHIRSAVFGDLDIRTADVLFFPKGMLGFPECRQFALLRGERDGLFWLQSMEYATLAFLLVDPFMVERDYSFDVPPSQLLELGASDLSDIGMLAVVTLPANRQDLPTVNLQGPIIINFRTRRAKQIVSTEGDFSVRRPVDLTRVVA